MLSNVSFAPILRCLMAIGRPRYSHCSRPRNRPSTQIHQHECALVKRYMRRATSRGLCRSCKAVVVSAEILSHPGVATRESVSWSPKEPMTFARITCFEYINKPLCLVIPETPGTSYSRRRVCEGGDDRETFCGCDIHRGDGVPKSASNVWVSANRLSTTSKGMGAYQGGQFRGTYRFVRCGFSFLQVRL